MADGQGDDSTTNVCMNQADCSDIPMTSAELAGVFSQTLYTDNQYFEGTCDNPQPVTCDQRTPKDDCESCKFEKCCAFVALCDDDPNCRAIAACVNQCKDDACTETCMVNGEFSASRHLHKLLSCTKYLCTDRC